MIAKKAGANSEDKVKVCWLQPTENKAYCLVQLPSWHFLIFIEPLRIFVWQQFYFVFVTHLVDGSIVYVERLVASFSALVCDNAENTVSFSASAAKVETSPPNHWRTNQAVSNVLKKPRATPVPVGQKGCEKKNMSLHCKLNVRKIQCVMKSNENNVISFWPPLNDPSSPLKLFIPMSVSPKCA